MGGPMEKTSKETFLTAMAAKYKKADRAERSTLLDQIVKKLAVHRKSAIRALRSYLGGATKTVTKKVAKKTTKKVTKKVTKKAVKKAKKK